MNDYLKYIIGVMLIVYGIFKCVIGIAPIVVPLDILAYLSDIPLIGPVFSPDKTFAAMYLGVFIILFGAYSISRGLINFHVIENTQAITILESRDFLYAFNAIIGIALASFFYLVVYTSFPIEKNENEMIKYRMIGFCGGLIFLLYTLVGFAFFTMYDHGVAGAFKEHTMTMFTTFLLIFIFGAAILSIYFDYYFGDKEISWASIMDLIIVPLNFF